MQHTHKRSAILPTVVALLLASCQRDEQAITPEQNRDVASSTPVKVTNPYPDAAEVRLFVLAEYGSEGRPARYTNAEGTILNAQQRAKFEGILRMETLLTDRAACFIPHHFFRYFDAAGQQIGEVKVCFCCEGIVASGSERLTVGVEQIVTADYNALKDLVISLDQPADILCE